MHLVYLSQEQPHALKALPHSIKKIIADIQYDVLIHGVLSNGSPSLIKTTGLSMKSRYGSKCVNNIKNIYVTPCFIAL
jgi:hypothetical protein